LLAIGRRALEPEKPVLMWKVGNSRAGSRAATSHTGRLSAGPELFRRAIAQGGFIEIGDTEDVVDLAQFLAYRKRAQGNRVAILTLSGGAGVLAADLCDANGLEVPETSAETLAKLKPLSPDLGSLGNPIDLTPTGYDDAFAAYNRVIEAVLAAPEFDQAIVRSAPGSIAAAWAPQFVAVAQASEKPILLQWGSGSERNEEAFEIVRNAGIPSFLSPRRSCTGSAPRLRATARETPVRSRARSRRRRSISPRAAHWASGARNRCSRNTAFRSCAKP
jgi:acyl-CoA synthetase (NDP forming)